MVTALNGRAAQRLFDPSIRARRLSIDEVESALAKFDDVDHNALKKDLSDIFTEYTSMMESHERDVRKLREDSGNSGIETNAHDEGELFALFVAEWGGKGTELLPYLRPLFEIACALKGYKSQVRHVTVLQAGAATHPNSRAIET